MNEDSIAHVPRTPRLTALESAVAACLLDGMGNKGIARAVLDGVGTVKSIENHVHRLRVKYGAMNRTHLALLLERQCVSERDA